MVTIPDLKNFNISLKVFFKIKNTSILNVKFILAPICSFKREKTREKHQIKRKVKDTS